MYEYRVQRVLRVVDADTIDACLSVGFGDTKTMRFRLHGVDAPERYGPLRTELGAAAQAYVERWLAEREGRLRCRTYKGAASTVGVGDGAFGRWLADFYTDGAGPADSLSQALLAWLAEQG